MRRDDTTNLKPQGSAASLTVLGLSNTLPDIDRPDVRIAVVRQFPVDSPAQQRDVADATLAAWHAAPWPDALISRTCYVSTDEQRVLTYEQWRDDQPDLEDPAAIAYRLYRSGVRDDAPVPGCIVIVEVQTDTGDTARTWIDAVFDALAAEVTLHPGGISGHFHVSLDGTRVLNYAEWVDEASHIEAVSGTGSLGRGPAWNRVHTMSGVVNLGVRRFRKPSPSASRPLLGIPSSHNIARNCIAARTPPKAPDE
jgi:hypothetical protein